MSPSLSIYRVPVYVVVRAEDPKAARGVVLTALMDAQHPAIMDFKAPMREIEREA